MKDYQKETIETYNKNAQAYSDNRKNLIMVAEIKELVEHMPGKEILDIGCGPGRDLAYFVSLGLHATGIDLSEKLLDIARRQAPEASVSNMDMLSLSFKDETFDGIWSLASLLHLKKQDAPQALSEMYRVLKPGGAMFVSVKVGVGEERLTRSESKPDKKLYAFYQPDEFELLVKNAGFKIIKTNVVDKQQEFGNATRHIHFVSVFAKKSL